MAQPKLGLWGVDALPGAPDSDLKRRVLAAYLENPFLDDDLPGLCLRLGANRQALQAALDDLCTDGFLAVGARGHMLELSSCTAPVDKGADEAKEPDAVPNADKIVEWPVEAAPVDQATVDQAPANQDSAGLETVVQIFDALPYGALLLDAEGSRLAANALCIEWTGLALIDLDAEGMRSLCGADPLQGVRGHNCQAEGRPLVFDSRPFPWQGGQAWLVSLRPTLSEGECAAQMAFQEELFATFKERLVKPLEYVEAYLDDPESGLGAARAALAQINWFLQDIYLTGGEPPEE